MSLSPQKRQSLRSKYRNLGLIGQGQFGKVYCAIQRKTGKLVALKSLDRYRLSTQQFLRELRFLLSLRHRYIVPCQTLEHTPRGRYLVMDYCSGGTLRDLIEGEQSLVTWVQGMALLRGVLQGLSHAHKQNIIHCDIKPENILLEPTPQGWIPRITDFGIAHAIQEFKTGSGTSGSPAYMAPERFYGQYHLSSDLYAVGVILFELCLGYRPFTGTPMELMNAHLNQTAAIPENLPPDLQSLLAKSLQKLPARRFQSAEDMGTALDRVMAQLGSSASAVAPGTIAQSPYFQSPPLASPCPLTIQRCWHYDVPLDHWAVRLDSSQNLVIYTIQGATLTRQSYGPLLDTPEQPLDLPPNPAPQCLTMSEALHQVYPLGDGCLLAGDLGVYHWRSSPNQANSGILSPCLLQQSSLTPLQVDRQERWFATLGQSPQPQTQIDLHWGRLPYPSQAVPPTQRITSPGAHPSQVFLLDEAHGVLLVEQETKCQLQVFNRRGHRLGELSIPLLLRLGQITDKPYRLVGREGDLPHLIFVDLKPVRIRRVVLTQVPEWIVGFPWGYILIDAQQQLLLIDRDGAIVNRGNLAPVLPAQAHLTGAKALGNTGLVLGTGDRSQSPTQTQQLHLLNLRSLPLDLIL